MEAMTQKLMLHRRPHVEIWSAREGSDDDTSKIHLRNKILMDHKQCQPRTRDPLQTPNSISNHGPLQKPKSDENPNHNQRITNKVHLRHKRLMDLNNPHVHLVHIRNKTSDGSEQDMNQTQVFFPGSDYTSYKEIGGKSQILTARILRRLKSRRRIGKP